MSNYLDNLAAKTLNLTEVVQPRLASLFEPAPTAPGSAGILPASVPMETAHDEQFSGGLAFETSQTAQPQSDMADNFAGQRSRPLASQQPSLLIVPPVETKPEQRSAQPTPNPATPSRNTGEQEGHSALEQNRRPIVDGRVASLEVPRSQKIGHTELVPTQAIHSLTPATVFGHRRELETIKPATSAPAKPIVTQEPAPTIRITIGRVEVRAIMPSSPVPRPKSSPPGPRLSLEDYLKQSQGGRR